MASDKDPENRKRFLSDLEKKLRNQPPGNGEEPGKNGKKDPEKPQGEPGRFNVVTLLILVGLLVATIVYLSPSMKGDKTAGVPYSDFVQGVKTGKISQVVVINNERIEFKQDGSQKETRIPYLDQALLPMLLEHKVTIESRQIDDGKWWMMLLQWAPFIILLVVFWVMVNRQFKGRMGNAFSFGKSKAKLIGENDIKTTFKDVEGCEEAKEELQEIVSFLKDPRKYVDLGAKIPKGVLLVGPPGTGKTLLGKAVAGEAKVPFYSMSGSDFVEMFVGVGASRVRDLFETGKKNAPCILFIDEIDAVGRMRGAGYGGGHDEREQTLNQLLVEMDGFETNEAVIIMAATNRPDVLDRALMRPGRFDRQVVVDVPDVKGRLGILKIHAAKVKLENSADLEDIARGTPGFTGADLANLVNEAALLAGRGDRKVVVKKDLEQAKDKVMMGSERRSMLISLEEKRNTAYHEAGHALIGLLLTKGDTLHKVSIIPRGRALGLTYFFPEDGVKTMTKSKLLAGLRMLYGGRVAEEIVMKDFTTGASNDIERATKIARSMVCEWGMSRLGPISFGEKDQPVFIGREITRMEDFSDETARIIDEEVKSILDEAYKDTMKLLKSRLSDLKILAEALLVQETMDAGEIYDLLKMKRPAQAKIDFQSKPPETKNPPPAGDVPAGAPLFAPEPPPVPT